MDPLTEDHELQVQGYLRFAKFKRDQHLREVKQVLADFGEFRVRDNEVYTTKEARALVEELGDQVLQVFDTELENSSYSSGLLLRLLFQQAEMADLLMAADTNELENEYLLKQIADSAAEALKKPASAFAQKPQRLSKLGSEKVSDARVLKERDDLRRKVQEVEQRLCDSAAQASSQASASEQARALQEQLAATQAELEAERAKVASLLQKDAGGPVSADAAKEIAQLKHEFQVEAEDKEKEHIAALAEAKKKSKKMKAEVDKLAEELRITKLEAGRASEAMGAAEGRMSESKQFQQMRKIMQQKSEEVTTLRRRLAKYEPESVADGDA
mmetsp:Transcript_38291/g.108259  ORF Transcript_38291/g.108259 Transcript_38291/m.108259 type:complete len:329 (-) Transcript_38291:144-1130(-)|eukprot:CAMPEP_0117682332 /NCGR_PEP_ID=MMETSP0804-20121206/19587_1 /TAXON_ID=1074897 /ORGANISM="Tetraselmis astigmatica, Strain CCMP880" /LENGTH=328 /DNA_ID=CAMNT_0005492405 /DNA_START=66 /DNA_END=1052 /DNA_ORIENTATION=+